MTIDKLSDNRVLIVLCKNDMSDLSLEYGQLSFTDGYSKKILMRILRLACMKEGIELSGKSVLLEAISFDEECYLLVTVKSGSKRKYKLKSSNNSLCYKLGSSGNFLDAIEKLYRQNVYCNYNAAYMYNDEYYLIFDYPSIPHRLRRILSEYGTKIKGGVHSARIKENGTELCKRNAITQIGKFLV